MHAAQLWANGNGLMQMYRASVVLVRRLIDLLPFSHFAFPLFSLQGKVLRMSLVPHLPLAIIVPLLRLPDLLRLHCLADPGQAITRASV